MVRSTGVPTGRRSVRSTELMQLAMLSIGKVQPEKCSWTDMLMGGVSQELESATLGTSGLLVGGESV